MVKSWSKVTFFVDFNIFWKTANFIKKYILSDYKLWHVCCCTRQKLGNFVFNVVDLKNLLSGIMAGTIAYFVIGFYILTMICAHFVMQFGTNFITSAEIQCLILISHKKFRHWILLLVTKVNAYRHWILALVTKSNAKLHYKMHTYHG